MYLRVPSITSCITGGAITTFCLVDRLVVTRDLANNWTGHVSITIDVDEYGATIGPNARSLNCAHARLNSTGKRLVEY